MNHIEEKRLNRKATRVMVIILLVLGLMIVLLSSCEYDSNRRQRVDNTLTRIDSTAMRVYKDEVQPTYVIPVAHPDLLHSHIVMDKTTFQRIDGNEYQRILTWNYKDSVYQLYYMPIAVSVCLTYHDTIHIVYPKYDKPKD